MTNKEKQQLQKAEKWLNKIPSLEAGIASLHLRIIELEKQLEIIPEISTYDLQKPRVSGTPERISAEESWTMRREVIQAQLVNLRSALLTKQTALNHYESVLGKLRETDPRAAEVVALHFGRGMGYQRIATQVYYSESTFFRKKRKAVQFFHDCLFWLFESTDD